MTAARTYDSAGGLDHGRKKISCALSPSEVASLMDALAREFPNPRPALVFKNPFELLCAVALSAQATDASVNLATPALFKAAPDPEAMAALGEDGIAPYIKSIGLWRAKSRNLAALSKILCERHGGQVPDDLVTDQLRPRPAGGGQQDCERRVERGLRASDHRGGHAHLQGVRKDRAVPAQERPGSREGAALDSPR